MANFIKLELETIKKLHFIKSSLEEIEFGKKYDHNIWRELIDCLDEIAADLQIDLPSAFDLANEKNYRGLESSD